MPRLQRFFVSLSIVAQRGRGRRVRDDRHQPLSAPRSSSQEQCCNRLADPNAQHACLADIPRTQDETSPINQETFQCVEKHFSCDPATGRATRDSAQQQLDCLNDLESTQQARNETPAPAK